MTYRFAISFIYSKVKSLAEYDNRKLTGVKQYISGSKELMRTIEPDKKPQW